jgi:hypothetical protein
MDKRLAPAHGVLEAVALSIVIWCGLIIWEAAIIPTTVLQQAEGETQVAAVWFLCLQTHSDH